jgi:predicted ATPase
LRRPASKVLTPELLLERLDVTLPMLTGGARDAPERQRTLRATIEWSYNLLEAATKELFERLSVFAGGFPIRAAEQVCEADLDRLEALVDSSLLKPIGDDRFLMLETIREYARERAEGSVETEALRQRYATFFLAEQVRASLDAEAERLNGSRSTMMTCVPPRLAGCSRAGACSRPRGCTRLVLVHPRSSGGGQATADRRTRAVDSYRCI